MCSLSASREWEAPVAMAEDPAGLAVLPEKSPPAAASEAILNAEKNDPRESSPRVISVVECGYYVLSGIE
jgi:hypothetical protein